MRGPQHKGKASNEELACGTMLQMMWNDLTQDERDLVEQTLREHPGMSYAEAMANVRVKREGTR